ncbi:hypothetical protein PoB_005011500 [Plakobranchus ocellatus]|uniref:Uncharacterized protein n=1 Tax=Plakobranchus ocellatus TaxID=259542 RepID=A0AAV4BWV4_9GAST|nr:hypothetical protein PoB_005011500 [Plakobranchus ocellatus]
MPSCHHPKSDTIMSSVRRISCSRTLGMPVPVWHTQYLDRGEMDHAPNTLRLSAHGHLITLSDRLDDRLALEERKQTKEKDCKVNSSEIVSFLSVFSSPKHLLLSRLLSYLTDP